MRAQSVAVVTPSYSGDFELCKLLNDGVLAYLPSSVRHYIVVDRSDVALFSELSSSRVTVAAVEDWIPAGLRHIPGTRRWFAQGTLVPIHGWLLQQIVKIAATDAVEEDLLVFADSDVMIARTVDAENFFRGGKPRLFCRPGGITSSMKSHIQWVQSACQLLDVPPLNAPIDDYIGNIVTWDRDIARQMRLHVEKVAGVKWLEAIIRSRRFSEYLLYGIFVKHVLGSESVWADARPLCREHWEETAITSDMVPAFVESMSCEDVSIMITSHSSTTLAVRKAILQCAQGKDGF